VVSTLAKYCDRVNHYVIDLVETLVWPVVLGHPPRISDLMNVDLVLGTWPGMIMRHYRRSAG
jgi:hypothetical protein